MQRLNISWAIFTGKTPQDQTSGHRTPADYYLTRRIVQHEAQNSMSIGNLAIVFGPTLFPPTAPNGEDGLTGATIQNKVCLASWSPMRYLKKQIHFQAIETILEHYTDIFVDESEAA
jgi:Rho GTPase-activating protein RGD1